MTQVPVVSGPAAGSGGHRKCPPRADVSRRASLQTGLAAAEL